MDGFKRIIVYSVFVSLVSLGFVAYIAVDAISGAKIPNAESGVVASKWAVSDGHAAKYTVTLESGRTLYIISNSTLYNELQLGSYYVFDGRIDFLGGMNVIDCAKLKPEQ